MKLNMAMATDNVAPTVNCGHAGRTIFAMSTSQCGRRKRSYGGEACGYVIEFSNGVKIYHAGDTNVFGDMAIIRELYAPDIALIPIGDHYTMSPREAAYACNLLKPKTVIPMHFGTFPVLTGRPGDLQKLVRDVEVVEMKPGLTIS